MSFRVMGLGDSKSWVKEYDDNHNMTHYRLGDDKVTYFEMWKTYDENNNVTSYRDSTGCYWEKKYDANNNVIYHRSSLGKELNNFYKLVRG